VPRIDARSLVADERVRFLVIGGVNTLLGYGLFAAFQLAAGHVIGYLGSLYASYVVAIVIAFALHRRFTFRVAGTGNIALDLLRYAGVSVVALAVNTAALPVLVELAGLHPLAAQAIMVVVTALISYVGHKFFSFRRARAAGPAA